MEENWFEDRESQGLEGLDEHLQVANTIFDSLKETLEDHLAQEAGAASDQRAEGMGIITITTVHVPVRKPSMSSPFVRLIPLFINYDFDVLHALYVYKKDVPICLFLQGLAHGRMHLGALRLSSPMVSVIMRQSGTRLLKLRAKPSGGNCKGRMEGG